MKLRVLSQLLALALALPLLACGSSYADRDSGGDAYRNQAMPMPLEEWVAGNLNMGEGDRTDWKSVALEHDGKLVVEFHADEPDVAVRVGVFDTYGAPLGSVNRPRGASSPVQITADVRSEGQYFIMIQQVSGGSSSYSVRATLGDGSSVPRPDF